MYLIDAPLQQIKSLIAHSVDTNKVIPQLHETAAWLSQRNDVLLWIISNEPQILLRSDVTKIDDHTKERLVVELLKRFLSEDLMDDRKFRDYYKKLSYPGIAEQLET